MLTVPSIEGVLFGKKAPMYLISVQNLKKISPGTSEKSLQIKRWTNTHMHGWTDLILRSLSGENLRGMIKTEEAQ